MNKCQKHTLDEAKNLLKQARTYYEDESFEESLNLLSHLLSDHKNEINICEAFMLKGSCLTLQGKPSEGLVSLLKSEELFKENENKLLYLDVTMCLSRCYFDLGDYNKAICCFNKGKVHFSLWENENYEDIITFKIINIMAIYFKRDFVLALSKLVEIESNSKKVSDEKLAIIYYYFAETYLALDNTSESETFLDKINVGYLNDGYKHSFLD